MALAIWRNATVVFRDATGVLKSEECCCGGATRVCDYCIEDTIPEEVDVTLTESGAFGWCNCADVGNPKDTCITGTYRLQWIGESGSCAWDYNFTSGPFDGLRLLLSVVNLGSPDEVQVAFAILDSSSNSCNWGYFSGDNIPINCLFNNLAIPWSDSTDPMPCSGSAAHGLCGGIVNCPDDAIVNAV